MRRVREENSKLREENAFLKLGRSSKTSHTPPSQDYSLKTSRNLREKTDKKPGGQIGHKGETLMPSTSPDQIILHKPLHCSGCGIGLENHSFSVVGQRQVVDIPPIAPIYIEHQLCQIVCQCKAINIGAYPPSVTNNIQYGFRIKAMIGYCHTYQYLPFGRIKSLLEEVCSVYLSEGTIQNTLKGLVEKAKPIYAEIRSQIERANKVGGDETGSSIEGKKGWFHVWQNETLTYIVASMSRGYATMETHFKDGFPNAVYVSDCWSGQLKVYSKAKQICLVHLLRELNRFIETSQCGWSKQFKVLLKKAIELKKDHIPTDKDIGQIQLELMELLQVSTEDKTGKIRAFMKRMIKYQDYLFTFLKYEYVPSDNNGSERAIRNIKVKTKVSTQFRTLNGAHNFAILRSATDTAIKHNQNVFQAFCALG